MSRLLILSDRLQKFKTFPETLVVHMKKFQLVNWMPTKLGMCDLLELHRLLADNSVPDIPVTVRDDLTMDKYLSAGKQDGEVELAESNQEASLPEFDAAALSQLEAMGFPLIRCQKALLATGNSDAEAAMNWLFQHMEDPGTLSVLALSSIVLNLPFRHRCSFAARGIWCRLEWQCWS